MSLTEAVGSFFWFGGLNSLRHLFEPLDAVSKMFSESERSLELAEGAFWTRTSKDTETVVALLKDERFTARLLVGHSKGNLVISEALYAIAAEDEDQARSLANRCRIITISAKIGMPRLFHDVIDVIGEWDWFGALNSRPDLPADYVVPRAWHSTNPDFPKGMGIDVTATLHKVLAMRPSAQAARPLKNASEILDRAATHDGRHAKLDTEGCKDGLTVFPFFGSNPREGSDAVPSHLQRTSSQ